MRSRCGSAHAGGRRGLTLTGGRRSLGHSQLQPGSRAPSSGPLIGSFVFQVDSPLELVVAGAGGVAVGLVLVRHAAWLFFLARVRSRQLEGAQAHIEGIEKRLATSQRIDVPVAQISEQVPDQGGPPFLT
jgi:hypothetical protein